MTKKEKAVLKRDRAFILDEWKWTNKQLKKDSNAWTKRFRYVYEKNKIRVSRIEKELPIL